MSMKSTLMRYGRNWAGRCWSKVSTRHLQTGVKKKTLCRYGKIQIAAVHSFSEAVHGFQISPYMQEKMVYAGQCDCYGAAGDLLWRFLGVEVSTTQVQRLTNTHGQLLESESTAQKQPEVVAVKADEAVYAQCDGSMILSREEGFKEVKVGRIFKESEVLQISEERGWKSTATMKPGWAGTKSSSAALKKSWTATGIWVSGWFLSAMEPAGSAIGSVMPIVKLSTFWTGIMPWSTWVYLPRAILIRKMTEACG